MHHIGAHLVVRRAHFVEDRAAEHSRPAADRALAAVEDVAGKVTRRHRVVEQRWLAAVGVLEAVAREQVIASGRQAVIDAHVELIDVVVEDAVRDEVAVEETGAGNVRHRVEVDQLGRHRVEAADTDHLADRVNAPGPHEGVGGHHVARQFAQVARAHARGRHRRRLRQRPFGARRLVVAKKEGLAAHQRAAEGAAGNQLVEGPLGAAGAVVVPGVGVERLVAKKREQRAAVLVGALFDRGVDHCAGRLAEFRRVGASLHLELRQRIHRRLHHLRTALLQVGRERVVIGPVERVVVPGGVVAVGVEERVFAATGNAGGSGHHPGREERQLRVAPAEQRQVADLAGVDHAADVG